MTEFGRDNRKSAIVRIALVFFFVAVTCIVAGVLGWYFTLPNDDQQMTAVTVGLMRINLTSRRTVFNISDKIVLSGVMGTNFPTTSRRNETCSTTNTTICYEYENGARLRIDVNDIPASYDSHGTYYCYDILWNLTKCEFIEIEDCYSLNSAHWFGGAQVKYQHWPIEKWSRPSTAFVAGDSYVDQYGGVLERYFVSSKGVAIVVDKDIPLFVAINASGDHRLCLKAKWEKPYIKVNSNTSLYYRVCTHHDIRSVHNYVSSLRVHPLDIPDERMFKDPIWSTWAQYKKDINQTTVLKYADDILNNNFTNSQLEIDDDWTPKYGDLLFNQQKFLNVTDMIIDLKSKGFRVTLWIHPFKNIDSMSFLEAAFKGFLLKDPGNRLPALTSWWDGPAAGILDVTNARAVAWFKQKLIFLKTKYGIDSFKFDAGETNWLPTAYQPNVSFENPDTYTRLFAQLAYEADSEVRHQEVRVAVPGTQHLPIFVRMMDKDSNWGFDNGLKTIIPDALTFGLLGFPFILPDMIGGNAYNGSLTGLVFPERELYIRWLELNALLPAMQFSITPWLYDDEVVRIAHKMVALHHYYTPYIIELARESVRDGSPIIRPLWWIAPNDAVALIIDSEFLLGDEILVAPVLEKGAVTRNIYLPVGSWKDHLRNMTLGGGKWYQDYAVALDELAYFTRLS